MRVCVRALRASSIYVSFGGLLLLLRGAPETLANIKPDSKLYLLMRPERD